MTQNSVDSKLTVICVMRMKKIYVVFVFLLTKLKRNLHIPVQKFISILFFERQLKHAFDNEKMFWTALKEKYFWIRIISQRVKKHFFL